MTINRVGRKLVEQVRYSLSKFFRAAMRSGLKQREIEAPWEAPEPPEFPFHPRDLIPLRVRPEDCSDQDGLSVLRLSGQSLGLVPREAMLPAEGMIRNIQAFHAISHPSITGDAASMNAVDCASFQTMRSAILWQAEPGQSLVFGAYKGVDLADVWFVNGWTLRLRFKPDDSLQGRSVILRCFQYDPDDLQRLLLLTEQPLSTDIPSFVDVTMANPYFPLGFAVCREEAEILSFALLPFPSLCRGGVHFGELLSAGGSKPYSQALEDVSVSLLQAVLMREGRPKLARIEVDLDAATGTERIFEKSLQLWLTKVLDVPIGVGHVPEDMDSEVLSYLASAVTSDSPASAIDVNGYMLLRLPADAVPSLHSLMAEWNGDAGSHAAPFVLASVVDSVPRYLLSPPSIGAGANRRPEDGVRAFPVFEVRTELDRPQRNAGDAVPPIAAIRLCRLKEPDEAQLLAPLGVTVNQPPGGSELMETPPVSIVHSFSGDEQALAAILEALTLQQGGEALQVLVAGIERHAASIGLLLQRFFPTRGHFISCPDDENEGTRLNRAAAQAEAEFILFLGDPVLLHDPCTIAVLASLMKSPGVASATCMLVGPQIINKTAKQKLVSSGYFAFAAPAGKLTEVSFENGDILLTLPRSIWPAAFNSSRLFMVGKEEWKRIGGFAEQRVGPEELGTPFWARSSTEGRAHVVTTAVSASLLPPSEGAVSRYRAAPQFLPAVDEASRLSLTIQRLVA